MDETAAAAMDDVAAAIADPVRRRILESLRAGPRTAGAIAALFDISRPAISRHLRILRESGLVRDEVSGRERIYELDTEPLAALTAWIADMRRREDWSRRLDALGTEVHRTRRERRATGTPAARPSGYTTSEPTTSDDTRENTA